MAGFMASMREMAHDKGAGSAKRRQQIVLNLLRCCRDEVESKYLVRTLIQLSGLRPT
ncbi:DNA ligase [Haematococcus lacustris]|uniref:DNA ligase n=1 Tax=Haematococcus lacustris TaxID=44745 RepID=A0A699YZH3_HAELA|nr:DNA ligase [Haematococcus lacustris]